MQAIVYFSKDNNTRTAAEYIAEHDKCKIVELKEKKKGNFIQALLKKGSTLEGNPWLEVEEVDTLILMTPIWASHGTPAMNAFLNKMDFNNITCKIVTFQQFSDYKNSELVHEHITKIVEDKGGIVTDRFAFLGGKMGHCKAKEDICKQVKGLWETPS